MRGDRQRRDRDEVRSFYDARAASYTGERYASDGGRVSRPYLERSLILETMLPVRALRLLDLGCGPGVLEPMLARRTDRLFAVDLSGPMVRHARTRSLAGGGLQSVGVAQAAAESLPFADGAFDAVVCMGVASYWAHPAAALSEIRRVLAPGGELVLQASDPFAPVEIENRYVRTPLLRLASLLRRCDMLDHHLHLHSYRPSVLKRMLRCCGLTPLRCAHYDRQIPLLRLLHPTVAESAARWLQASLRTTRRALATGYVVLARRTH